MRTLLVDGNNVMGTTADGWWRDRPGAMLRLFERVRCYATASGARVVLVFDVAHPDLPDGVHHGVTLASATRRGRDAGDDRIRELLVESEDAAGVEVVTSDRALAESARHLGATVSGAGSFLRRLDDAGC